MKTLLLIGGSVLLFYSCADSLEKEPGESLSDSEMKSRVEVEEISFEKKSESSSLDDLGEDELDQPFINVGQERERYPLPDRISSQPLPPTFVPVIQNNEVLQVEPVTPNFDAYTDAQFPGGISALKQFIQENIRYPNLEVSVQGTVYVSMLIDTDGSIKEEEVIRGVSEEFDQEALRLIRSMPNWIPAEKNGKIVATKIRLPIRFTLNEHL